MNIAMILGIIEAAKAVIAGAVTMGETLQQKGDITPEQLARIKAAAADSDTRWDQRIEQIKRDNP